MAKTSVLGSPSHIAKLPHQGFNLSHNLKFSSSCGQLIPVMYDFLRPGEKVKLNCALFSRTMPLATAAMADIFEYVDFFFVPQRKLYHNFDALITSVDDFGSVLLETQVSRSSDNVMPLFNSRQIANQVVSGAFDLSEMGSYGRYFDYRVAGAARLLDALELLPNMLMAYDNPPSGLEFKVPETYLPYFNPSVLLAYQAIYYDYYRLSNWEANNNKAYNVDDVMNGSLVDLAGDIDRLRAVLQLRYRPYQRDYFKAIEPSPLLSPIGTLGLVGEQSVSSLRQWLGLNDDGVTTLTSDGNSTNVFGETVSNLAVHQTQDTEFLSLSSLRTAYAFEKLLKITNRAGKHYDDQVLAHFGFKVPRGISEEVYFLGGLTSKLTIGEVVATADTESDGSGVPLAEIAGKAYNIRDKQSGNGVMSDIDFTAPCDGVLMAVYSCVPKLSYVVSLNRLHTRVSKFDYPQPELDNLGMQPLFGYQGFAGSQPSIRVGWQYRYMESKVKYNRATHNFLGEYTYGQDLQAFGMQHDWAISRLPFLSDLNFDERDWHEMLLCRPTDLNDIMLVSYWQNIRRTDLVNGVWYNELYQRDPLIHDVSFKYYKTSFMSTFGIDDVDI